MADRPPHLTTGPDLRFWTEPVSQLPDHIIWPEFKAGSHKGRTILLGQHGCDKRTLTAYGSFENKDKAEFIAELLNRAAARQDRAYVSGTPS